MKKNRLLSLILIVVVIASVFLFAVAPVSAATIKASPSDFTVTEQSNGFGVKWKALSGVTGYALYIGEYSENKGADEWITWVNLPTSYYNRMVKKYGHYPVYSGTLNASGWKKPHSNKSLGYTYSLKADKRYCFQIVACNSSGKLESKWSSKLQCYYKPFYKKNKSINNYEKTTYNYLRNKGFNKATSCGIMGMICECCAFDSYYMFREFENAGGICAWYDDNFTRFKRDCPNWKTSITAQLDYFYETLKKNGKGVAKDKYFYPLANNCLNNFKKVTNKQTSVREATKVMAEYEGEAKTKTKYPNSISFEYSVKMGEYYYTYIN